MTTIVIIVLIVLIVLISKEIRNYFFAKRVLSKDMMAVRGFFLLLQILTGGKIRFVGGCVRDLLMGIPDDDIDIVIDIKDITILEKWLKKLGISSGVIQKSEFQTITFPLLGYSIDAVIPRAEKYNKYSRNPEVSYCSLEQDAKRRDFCCNAMYMDLNGVIDDPTGRGFDDVQNRVIHLAGEPSVIFTDDPLRILRAIRFEATKGFTIDGDTMAALKENAKKFIVGESSTTEKRITQERVQKELKKLFKAAPNGAAVVKAFTTMHEIGILSQIFPDVERVWEYQQNNKNHEWTLGGHLLRVLENTVDFLKTTSYHFPSWQKEGLCLAALLHDIAKPEVRTEGENGWSHYIGHELASAKKAVKILRGLKYSLDMIDFVSFIIENHMSIKELKDENGLFKAKNSTYLKKVEGFKLERKDWDLLIPCCLLIAADDLGHRSDVTVTNVYSFLERVASPAEEAPVLTKFKIDGNIVSEKLGIAKGPALGEAIKKIVEIRYEFPTCTDINFLLEEYKKRNC